MQKTMKYLSAALFFLAVMSPAEAHAFALTATLGLLGGALTPFFPGIGGAIAGALGTFNPWTFALGFQSELEERQHKRTVKSYGRLVTSRRVIAHCWPSMALSPATYLDKLQPTAAFGMGDTMARRAAIMQPAGTPIPPANGKPYSVGRCMGPEFPEGSTFSLSPAAIRSGDLVAFVCHAQAFPMVKRFCGRRADGTWLFYQRVPECIIAIPADMLLHVEKLTSIDLPNNPNADIPPDAMSEAIGLTLPVREVAAYDLPSLGDWHFALQVAIDEMRKRYAAIAKNQQAIGA